MKINDLISRNMITGSTEDTKADLERTMAAQNVHALPIIDDEGRALGIVTSNDLEPDLPDDTSVGDLMTDQVYTIDVEEDSSAAARMMLDYSVHHLVATEDDQAVGVLSSFDLLDLVARPEL